MENEIDCMDKDRNSWRRRRKSARERLLIKKDSVIKLKKKALEKTKAHKKGKEGENLTNRASKLAKQEKRIYTELGILDHKINTYSSKNR